VLDGTVVHFPTLAYLRDLNLWHVRSVHGALNGVAPIQTGSGGVQDLTLYRKMCAFKFIVAVSLRRS